MRRLSDELWNRGQPVGYVSFLTALVHHGVIVGIPVATPEKALVDWCWLAEEQGLYPRLEEMEWSILDRERLDQLAAETGISYRRLLPPEGASRHDQARLRAEVVSHLR